MRSVLAVDVGGTNIKSAVFDENLQILNSQSIETPSKDSSGRAVVGAVSALYRDLKNSYAIEGIGLAVPGTLDESRGIARWAGNLGWRDLPIVSMLEEEVSLPIAFKHDVRAGALAELRRGAMRGYNDAVFLPVGTGIACALVIDGEIRSADGFAGEIGHVRVNSQRNCVCGNFGCLEATSSTLAISKEYEKRSGKLLSTEEIVDSLASDLAAQEIFNEAIAGLVDACEILTTLLAPEAIVIGGGLSSSGEIVLSPIREGLKKRLTFQRAPEIKQAHFGIQSGMYGCGIMAWEKINV